jgi:hypothetical protein
MLNSVGFLGGGFTTYLLGKQNEGMAMFCISVACMIGFVRLRINMLEKQRLEMEEYIASQDEDDEEISEDDEEEDAPEEDAPEDDAPEDDAPEDDAPEDDAPEEGIHADDEASDDKDVGEPEESHYCAEETCGARIAPDAVAGICAGCSLVYYCNRDCQKKDWKAGHKLICNPKLPILHLSPIVSDDEDETVVKPVIEPEPVPVVEPVVESVVEPVVEPVPVPVVQDVPVVEPVSQVVAPPPTVTINGSKVTLPPPPPPPSSKKLPSIGFIV